MYIVMTAYFLISLSCCFIIRKKKKTLFILLPFSDKKRNECRKGKQKIERMKTYEMNIVDLIIWTIIRLWLNIFFSLIFWFVQWIWYRFFSAWRNLTWILLNDSRWNDKFVVGAHRPTKKTGSKCIKMNVHIYLMKIAFIFQLWWQIIIR